MTPPGVDSKSWSDVPISSTNSQPCFMGPLFGNYKTSQEISILALRMLTDEWQICLMIGIEKWMHPEEVTVNLY